MPRPVNVASLLRRLDDQAHDQLCAEVARLAEENEYLRRELAWAQDAAEGWRDDALALHEQLAAATGGEPGITQTGALVVVARERAA